MYVAIDHCQTEGCTRPSMALIDQSLDQLGFIGKTVSDVAKILRAGAQ